MTRAEISTSDLQVGDVLFYKTTLDVGQDGEPSFENLEAEHLGEFPALAAFVQSLPYHVRRGHHRPWYHVGVHVGDGQVVAFDYRVSQGELVDARMVLTDLDVAGLADQRVEVEVVRAPEQVLDLGVTTAWVIAHAARDQALQRIEYDLIGLLGFAFASLGWITPVSVSRAEALARARTFNDQAKQRQGSGESCVTATAKAVAAALGRELVFEEPPALPCRSLYEPSLMATEVVDMIRAALEQMRSRINGGRLGGGGEEVVLLEDRIDRSRLATAEAHSLEWIVGAPAAVLLNEQSWYQRGAGVIDPSVLGLEPTKDGPLVDEVHRNWEALWGFFDKRFRMGGAGDPPDLVILQVIYEAAAQEAIDNMSSDPDQQARVDDEPEPAAAVCGPLTSADYILSPAMLWEALQLECFTEVGVLRAPAETS